jgi:NAD(P)-dependent dehydrogenase (short-subunit alcohol dehydrogenase family)
MKVDLKDKVALVTGAARGIGKAIADTLAANDARVVYSDIDLASASTPPGCSTVQMDVTDEAQVRNVVGRIAREHGRLEILVNNAGVNTLQHRVPVDQFPRDEWDRLLEVDLNGLYIVSKAAAQIMRSQRSGRIINIASVVGLVPLRLQCAFVAAKAGVINLTKSMALELGADGITANAIAPGSILTEGTEQLFYGEDGKFKDSAEKLLAHIPVGRPGTPQEVAHAVLFLAAPEASYINGAVLTVDGGWTAGYMREF